jgi:hypothetical protein
MPAERLDTASVFERIFEVYRRQAAVLLPAAFVVYLVPSALSLSRSPGAQALALAASVIAAVSYQGMVVMAVRDMQDGVRDLSIAGLFRSVSPVLAQLLWTAILVGLGVFAGFVAFVIPGLVLLTQWSVAAPAVVIERSTATRAIGRSRTLVHGNGWRVFGVLMVTVVIVFVVDALLLSLAAAVSGGAVSIAVANLIGGVLTAPLFALASAVLYLALRSLRGEPTPGAGA